MCCDELAAVRFLHPACFKDHKSRSALRWFLSSFHAALRCSLKHVHFLYIFCGAFSFMHLSFLTSVCFLIILLSFNQSSFVLSLSFSSFSGRQTSKQTQHPEHPYLQLWIPCGFFFVLWPIFFTLWTPLPPVTFLCLNLPSQVAKHTAVVTLTGLCVYFCILWQSLACETQAILNTATLGQAH